jgi:polysaccharide biosynthesis transport protein
VSGPQPFERARESDSLSNLLGVLRRRWLVAASVLIVCVGVAVVHQERQPKTYAATSSVAFQSGTLSDAALQVTPSGGEPQREANTEVLVAHSSEVAEAVRSQLQLKSSPSELLGDVEVEAAPNANVLNIIASSGNPQEAKALANAFSQQYIEFRARSQLSGIEVAQSRLEQQLAALPEGSAERTALEQSVQRLNALRAVAGGGASIIGLAGVGKPVGKTLSTSIVLGFVVGLALAFSLVFLLESLDRRIKTIEEFEREYRLPVLAGVPRSGFGPRRAVDRTPLLEPYRILRSALDFAAVARQLETLMVTSAVAGEGKTTVAVDLAHAIALAGRRVVLIEFDLRRPTFADHFNLDPGDGLTTALTSGASLTELLVEPLPDVPNLSVLPAGRIPHNPSELLGSPAISEFVSELASPGSMVIVDAPPLNPVADAHVLLNNSAIHAVVLVARLDKTTRDEVRRARRTLDRHIVEPVGIVVTGLRDVDDYGYESYDGQPTLESDVGPLSRPRSSMPQRLPH